MANRTISPADVRVMRTAGTVHLIDVRTPADFRRRHARGAKSVPADTLDPAAVAAVSALAALVHPAFVAVPLFVGAALVVTGLIDWCGMGLLLARMPWNRGGPGTARDLPGKE